MKQRCTRVLPILLTLLAILLLAGCKGKDNGPTATTEAPYTGDPGSYVSEFYTGTLPTVAKPQQDPTQRPALQP
ncbi:MAG: hypothetical protein LBC83_08345 [Oscillospiraceae bacterium]|jgi:hypothetical protein|nr:hypothetical protein [Oscillospiraceae bacterium]